MQNLRHYFIIFLEGFVVLSVELLAIRLTIPFVGSGTDTVSIVIAAILMPLALGYYRGGLFQPKGEEEIDLKLQKNFLISLVILCLGLSFSLLTPLFEYLIEKVELRDRWSLTILYAGAFVVIPTYLLGQTIPIISHYFKGQTVSEAAGKILFFSTIGSFLGAVFTTLVLMNFIGVPYTACVSLTCLFILIFLVSKRQNFLPVLSALIVLIAGIVLNSGAALRLQDVVSSNAYNFVQVREFGPQKKVRYLKLNGAYSSSIFPEDTELPMAYAEFVEKYFIRPMQRLGPEGKILIIGAGGFTIGRTNAVSDITYIDIDPQLLEVVQKEFLKTKVGKNVTFVPEEARAFLIHTKEKYDLILVDMGKGVTGSPEQVVSYEFFQTVKNHLKNGGMMLSNYYISPFMEDDFSRNLDTTLHSVFPHLSRQILEGFNPWLQDKKRLSSVVYIYRHQAQNRPSIYTDMLNRSALDKGRILYD